MKTLKIAALGAGLLVLGACSTVPSGPSQA